MEGKVNYTLIAINSIINSKTGIRAQVVRFKSP